MYKETWDSQKYITGHVSQLAWVEEKFKSSTCVISQSLCFFTFLLYLIEFIFYHVSHNVSVLNIILLFKWLFPPKILSFLFYLSKWYLSFKDQLNSFFCVCVFVLVYLFSVSFCSTLISFCFLCVMCVSFLFPTGIEMLWGQKPNLCFFFKAYRQST